MITNAVDLDDGMVFDCDIAIVGAGPAGVTVAEALKSSGLRVMLFEAGGNGQTASTEPYQGTVLDHRHPDISLYRSRALGGSSTVWGGRCVPYDPIDLEERPWIAHSRWPLTYAELLEWYNHATGYAECGPAIFNASGVLGEKVFDMVPGLKGGPIDDHFLERFSKPTDFGKAHLRHMEQSQNHHLILGARLLKIQSTDQKDHVEGLSFATENGKKFDVRAGRVVLAMGGLEIARIMLINQLGNRNVGRFYQCHVEGKAASIRFRKDVKVLFKYERDQHGVYFRRHFSIPADIQRQYQMTNVKLRFEPPVVADASHGDPILSAIWLSSVFIKKEYELKLVALGYRGVKYRNRLTLAAAHLRNVLLGSPELAIFAADWAFRHGMADRKLPYVATKGRDNRFWLDFSGEQVPNPDSRVYLGDEVDALGQPRLVVDWKVSEQDIASVLKAHHLFRDHLHSKNLGEMDIDEEIITHGYNAAGGHHIGTARMASDPDEGVVDANALVYGMDNLYVAGAAVLPTGSHANPTLTLVALAARLGAHLQKLAKVSVPGTAPDLVEAAE